MNHIRKQRIPLIVQLMHLQRAFPSGSGQIVRDRLIWKQSIRPHALAHEYACRLEYSFNWYPRFYVVEPRLSELAAGRPLPHVRQKEEPVALCLFVQDNECWNDSMLLADIVVPMAYFWLASFEEWIFTGEWLGGGTHEISIDPPKTSPVFPSDLKSEAA